MVISESIFDNCNGQIVLYNPGWIGIRPLKFDFQTDQYLPHGPFRDSLGGPLEHINDNIVSIEILDFDSVKDKISSIKINVGGMDILELDPKKMKSGIIKSWNKPIPIGNLIHHNFSIMFVGKEIFFCGDLPDYDDRLFRVYRSPFMDKFKIKVNYQKNCEKEEQETPDEIEIYNSDGIISHFVIYGGMGGIRNLP